MFAIAMNSPEPHIPSKDHQNELSLSQAISCTPPSPPMLVASPSTLSPNKRPKLSLQTASVPIAVGKSSTALSIPMSALQASSPTVRNTFNNAYDIPHRPSPGGGSSPSTKWPKPVTSNISKRDEQPYALPLNVKGILRNAPLFSLRRSALSTTNSASPRTRRVFFPAAKKVAYRTPLEEEIQTVEFTARHSDLSSEATESDSSSQSDASITAKTPIDSDEDSKKKRFRSISPIFKRTGKTTDTSDDATTPQSPRTKHGKRKRKPREWRWTLGQTEEDDIAVTEPTVKPRTLPIASPRPVLSLDTKNTTPVETDEKEARVRKTPFPFGGEESSGEEEATIS